MFNNLSDKLDKAFHVLKGHGSITEVNVAETLKEVRRALLDADVNFKTAKDFTTRVKEKALGRDVLTTVSPGQLLTKICHEELVELMGGEQTEINFKGNPGIILMAGLQGSGKTTHSGKLALWLKDKQRKTPLLVACDVYRPAAIDQLHVLGEQLGVEVYSNREEKNPVKIAEAGIAHEEEILDQDGNYVTFTVTPFRVDMELSYKEFRSHTSKCNLDFKENIMKQVQTIKLKDTDELSKKVGTSLIIN